VKVTDVATDDSNAPPSTKEEGDALFLEFQRLATRLTYEGYVSVETSTRLVRVVNQERRHAEDRRRELSKLVLAILRAIEDGVLEEREHFVRLEGDRIAMHLESIAKALVRPLDVSWNAREMRRVFRDGSRRFRDVVVTRSGRARFGDDRRRVVVLHAPSAYQLAGNHVGR